MTENQNTEYKQSWHDDYLKWICGFANASGGVLFIGIKDDGSIVGIENFLQLSEEIPNKSKNLMGVTITLTIKMNGEKHFIEIRVPSYSIPISLRGRYYIRSGCTNLELSGNSLNEFLLKKYGKSWEDETEPSFIERDLDISAIDEFKNLSLDRIPSIKNELDQKTNLIKIKL